MRTKKVYAVNKIHFEDGRPMYLDLSPEALHPYSQNRYRVVDCAVRYNKKYPYDNIALKILTRGNATKIVSVRYRGEAVDIYKKIRNNLKTEIPVVVAFERLVALTYNFNKSSGIALHGVGLSVIDIENLSFSDEEKIYYTAPIKCTNHIADTPVYINDNNRECYLPVVSIDETTQLPIVLHEGKEYRTEYRDIVRNVTVCNLAICKNCIRSCRDKSCRRIGEDRNIYLVLAEPILQ